MPVFFRRYFFGFPARLAPAQGFSYPLCRFSRLCAVIIQHFRNFFKFISGVFGQKFNYETLYEKIRRAFARAEREKQSLALYLSLSSSKTAVALLSSAFPELLSPSKEKLRQIGENLFVLSEKSLPGAAKENEPTDHTEKTAFFSFSSEPLSVPAAETVLRTLKNVFSENDEQEARAVFFCVSVKDEAAALFRRFRVQCITLDEIFEKTKTADLLPAEIADLSAVSKKKKLLSEKITKKTSKSLLVSSAILLFTSLFSPFPYYYRAIGLLLLALSLAVRLLAVRPLRASQDTGGADNKKTSER